jgi:hypothetical protein
MARYEVWGVARPQGWKAASLDDVPPQPGQPLGVLAEADGLLPAVRRAMDENKAKQDEASALWAVVVERGCPGRIWRNARLATPLGYRVTAIWWPTGWEPRSPLDVPSCLWRAQGETNPAPLSYEQALSVLRGLNQQSMDHASPLWYVLMAVENEPISQTVSYDPAGIETTVQVRRLHVIRPEGSGAGDCSYCPAHSLECAAGEAELMTPTASTSCSRSLYADF